MLDQPDADEARRGTQSQHSRKQSNQRIGMATANCGAAMRSPSAGPRPDTAALSSCAPSPRGIEGDENATRAKRRTARRSQATSPRGAITGYDDPVDLAFPRADGAPWSDHDWRNWRRRVFRGAAQRAGISQMRPYDLRHHFVSLLLSEGRSIVDVAAQAGHAPSLSYDTYGHVLYDLDPTENRPAEAVIGAARTAGVPTVFPRPASPMVEQELESAVCRRNTKPSQGLEPWTPSLPSGSEQEPEFGPDHFSPFVDEDPDS